MNVDHNDPDKFIGNPDKFYQYIIWILCKHSVTNIQTSITHISNAQMDGV